MVIVYAIALELPDPFKLFTVTAVTGIDGRHIQVWLPDHVSDPSDTTGLVCTDAPISPAVNIL